MTETRKIMLASGIGGLLGTFVALAVAPLFWWLGIIAGFCAGWLAYEFREVLKVIPKAFTAAYSMGDDTLKGVVQNVSDFFSKKHPFIYPSIVLSMPIYALLFYFIFFLPPVPIDVTTLTLGPIFWLMVDGVATVVTILLLYSLTCIGSYCIDRAYFRGSMVFNSASDGEQTIRYLEHRGRREKPLTYANVLRWSILGIWGVLLFVFWILPKFLCQFAWGMLKLLGQATWHVIQFVRSSKRTICGIGASFGSACSYMLSAQPVPSLGQEILIVLFGGLLGASFGLVSWYILLAIVGAAEKEI